MVSDVIVSSTLPVVVQPVNIPIITLATSMVTTVVVNFFMGAMLPQKELWGKHHSYFVLEISSAVQISKIQVVSMGFYESGKGSTSSFSIMARTLHIARKSQRLAPSLVYGILILKVFDQWDMQGWQSGLLKGFRDGKHEVRVNDPWNQLFSRFRQQFRTMPRKCLPTMKPLWFNSKVVSKRSIRPSSERNPIQSRPAMVLRFLPSDLLRYIS